MRTRSARLSPAGRAHPYRMFLLVLPDELCLLVLQYLPASGLVGAGATCQRLLGLMEAAVKAQWVAAHCRCEHPCALRALWTDERLSAAIGHGLRTAWRQEWPELNIEQETLHANDHRPPRELFMPGSPGSIEAQAQLGLFAASIRWAVEHGWPVEEATAYVLLFNHGRGALGAAVRECSSRFAASTRVLCRALRTAALRQPPAEAAPATYSNLEGDWGLLGVDPAWAVLLERGVAVGISFVTTAVAGADVANSDTFPNGKGIHVPITFEDGETVYALQRGPVVRFVSRPADRRGYHSLIRTTAIAYDLPPFATVRLEAVHEPRCWRVNGKTMQQRGLTVSVTHG